MPSGGSARLDPYLRRQWHHVGGDVGGRCGRTSRRGCCASRGASRLRPTRRTKGWRDPPPGGRSVRPRPGSQVASGADDGESGTCCTPGSGCLISSTEPGVTASPGQCRAAKLLHGRPVGGRGAPRAHPRRMSIPATRWMNECAVASSRFALSIASGMASIRIRVARRTRPAPGRAGCCPGTSTLCRPNATFGAGARRGRLRS